MREQLHQDFTDILADCLEGIESGHLTVADCLAAYPDHAAELQDYLQLVSTIKKAEAIRPSSAFRRQARANLLARLPPQPAAPVTFWQAIRHSWQNLMLRRKVQMNWIVLVISAIVALAGGGAVYAADSAVPGDKLYSLDIALESVRLSLVANPESTVNLQLQFAQERLDEANQLLAAGETARAQAALDAYGRLVTGASQTIIATDANQMDVLTQQLEDNLVEGEVILTAFGEKTSQERLVISLGAADDEPAAPPCAPASAHPVGQSMANRYGVTYEEIMGWFCSGFGFGEIGIAYGLSQETGTAVADIFALRASGLGWGQIRALLNNTDPDLTPTPVLTATATITATPPITGTATVTATTPAPTGTPSATDCTGANPQPQATTLAGQYGVSYAEIMGWFCGGFGFGEIDQAYSLSQETGTPVADIFAMKASGMGWGEIRQALLGNAAPPGSGNPGGGNPGGGNSGNANPGNGNGNPGGANPGNDNPGDGNPGNGNGNPGSGNPGGGNSGNANPGNGNGNPGNGNPGGGNSGNANPGNGNGNPGNGNPGGGNPGHGNGGNPPGN